jgi:hypothetical protein
MRDIRTLGRKKHTGAKCEASTICGQKRGQKAVSGSKSNLDNPMTKR